MGMIIGLIILAILVLGIATILFESPEHMRLDTERVNREHYEHKQPRHF